MAEPRPITFLSDYGYEDEFAGVCRAVISQIAPEALVVDLGHGVGRQNILHGAVALANALPFCSPGVHLAAVDPGVGTNRRCVAVRVENQNRMLVGPDNGLFTLAIERLGGAAEAVDLDSSAFRLEPVSATFHGRDIFAPVAAHLAMGARLEEAGTPIDPADLVRIEMPLPDVSDGQAIAHCIHVDHFGNASLDLSGEQIADWGLETGSRIEIKAPDGSFEAVWATTFADAEPGDLLLFKDSSGSLAIAANGGNAAALLDLEPRGQVELTPA
jgi:S-adenosylmethionine hydrolase